MPSTSGIGDGLPLEVQKPIIPSLGTQMQREPSWHIRWWLVPGDPIWDGRKEHKLWAKFTWDDGHLWGMDVESTESGSELVSVLWDHQADHMIHAERIGSEAAAALRDVLQKRAAVPTYKRGNWEGEAQVLDFLATELDSVWPISGKRVRARLGQSVNKERLQRAMRRLQPRFIDLHGRDEDAFTPTLPGLLASSRGEEVRSIISAVLTVLRRKFSEEPDFTSFQSDEVRAVASLAPEKGHFLGHVVLLAGLASGGMGTHDPALGANIS